MENYIVSARKYRPLSFTSVVGQDSITLTLKNAIALHQLAHAYLFCGPRGIGKTTCARIFAKTINCETLNSESEACNECESCLSFNEARSFSIHELDAASNNSVDDIRNLNDQVRIPPQIGKYSIYIIDEVHMLSTGAFNAFLKTLEEPPSYVIFILATTEKYKILPTILSRCQIYDFKRIQVNDIVKYLTFISQKEGITTDIEALNVIAQKADGALRDSLSIFDQCVSTLGKNIDYKGVISNLNILDYDYYFKLVEIFLDAKITQALLIFNEILNKGFDAHNFITGLSSHLRSILVCKNEETIILLEVSDNIKEKYRIQAQNCPTEFIISWLNIGTRCDINYKQSKNQRLYVELALIQMCQLLNKKENIPSNANSKLESINKDSIKEESPPSPQISNPKPPTPKIQTPSIKDAIAGKITTSGLSSQVVTSKIQNPKPTEYYTEEQLNQIWNKYVESIKNDDSRLYSTLSSINPKSVGENKIECTLTSRIEEDYFNKKKHHLLATLKEKLQNYQIEIKTKIDIQKNKSKIYTDEDKFEYLNKKNPDLIQLKTKFALDFE